MSNDLKLSVGQANELKLAFRRSGWTNDDIKRLCEGDILTNVLRVLRGCASITVIEHVINCYSEPFNPWDKEGWTIEGHRRGGNLKFDPKQIKFFLTRDQRAGKTVEGSKLRKELAGKDILKANVLDYLLAHPEIIPDEWKTDENGDIRCIFFWGTIYRNSGGNLFVRYLYWNDNRWSWNYLGLGFDWYGFHPAAVLAA